MRLALSLVAAILISVAGYAGISAPLTMPAFHDGQAAPKVIATVVARPAFVPNLLGVR